jgi:hypothetical protein
MESYDGPPFAVSDPMVPRERRVVLVQAPVARAPGEELSSGDAQPLDEALDGKRSLRAPLGNEVYDGVSNVMGNPTPIQGSPSSFFRATYSAEMPAITPSFFAS